MKLVLPCSRDSEVGGEQSEEMLLWYCADSVQAQGSRMCVCTWWGWLQRVLSFMEYHAEVLKHWLQQPAAAKQKCLSGQQHRPHAWCVVRCSSISAKEMELDVKHLVHITAFKEDIYTIQKYSTLLCVCVVEWKGLFFQEEALWVMY